MMKPKTDFAMLTIVLASGGVLLSLYFVFLEYFAPTLESLSNPIELLIFYTLVVRVILLFCVPRLRRLPGQIKIGVLAVESFVLILVIVLFIVTGDPGYNTLLGVILTSWIAAGLVVITPYSILEFMVSMYKSSSVTGVLTMVAGEFATVVFLSNIAFQISPAPGNLSQLGIDLLEAVRFQPGGGITGFSPTNFGVDVIALVLYVCMIAYVIKLNSLSGRSSTFPFFLMLIGTFVLFAWSSYAISFQTDIFLALTVPAIGISIFLWVVSYEKK
jgi:hypothetical protein